MTTSPSAGSSRKVGLGIGDGSAAWSCRGNGGTEAALASPTASLAVRTAGLGWTTMSFGMAELTANAALFWRSGRPNAAPAPVKMLLNALHQNDRFHFHRNIAWQAAHANGGTRRSAAVTQHLDEQVGAAVDHFRMLGEIRHRIDHAQ